MLITREARMAVVTFKGITGGCTGIVEDK